MIPSYRILQDMFSHAFIAEENRLNVAVSSLPTAIIDQLVALVQRDDGITTLNIIRADQKDFQYTAVRMEVDKALRIEDLYQFARDFLPSLGLSKNAIRYYAEIAEQYAASRLRRLSKTQQWLQALCFVYHRYQQIMDNLIVSFLLSHAGDHGCGQNLCVDSTHGAQFQSRHGLSRTGKVSEMVSRAGSEHEPSRTE